MAFIHAYINSTALFTCLIYKKIHNHETYNAPLLSRRHKHGLCTLNLKIHEQEIATYTVIITTCKDITQLILFSTSVIGHVATNITKGLINLWEIQLNSVQFKLYGNFNDKHCHKANFTGLHLDTF